jgi:hypothetical protein
MIKRIFDIEQWSYLSASKGSNIHVLPDLHVTFGERVPIYLASFDRRYLRAIEYRRLLEIRRKDILKTLFTNVSDTLTLVDWHGEPFLLGFGVILLLSGEVACSVSVPGARIALPLKYKNARVFLGSMTRDAGWQARNQVLYAFLKKEVITPLQKIMLTDPNANMEIKIGDHDDLFEKNVPQHADPTPGETRDFLASMIKEVEKNGDSVDF